MKGWLASETHVSAVAIGALLNELHRPHFPAVHCVCAGAIALIAIQHARSRTAFKTSGAENEPNYVKDLFVWGWRKLFPQPKETQCPPQQRPPQ